MKKLLSFTLVLTLAALGSHALADDVTVMVTKASDTTAKITPEGKSTSSTVPITFASGMSWDDVKDSYTVSSDNADKLAGCKEGIMINSDGGISYMSTMMKSSMKKK
jgi:hypothetical protein